MKKIILISALITTLCTAFTNNHAGTRVISSAKDTTPAGGMKQYWMVFLLKGNNRSQDSVTAAQIQEGHMANITRLGREGVIILAGPMGYDKDLRGIFIIDAKDSATAAGYVKTDPAVIAGRLKFEIHPWWTAKGKYEFK
jgi:uncharacterized protein YciI